MKMRNKSIWFDARNKTFGISKKLLSEEDLDFVRDFGNYLIGSDENPKVVVTSMGFDRYKIVNRINIYIEFRGYSLNFHNVYCGGVYGTDRIFEVLYNFEYLLQELTGKRFNHYSKYALSNKYKWL